MTPTLSLDARLEIERQIEVLLNRHAPNDVCVESALSSEDERRQFVMAQEFVCLALDKLRWLRKRHPVYARERRAD